MDPNSPSQGPQEPPVAAELADRPPPPPPPPPRKPRRATRWLLVLLVLGLCGSLLLNVILFAAAGLASLASLDGSRGVQEKYHSYRRDGRSKVAIISIEGVILQGEGFVKRQIDRAIDDPGVKAVVLRVDSPGGTVTGSDYIYHHLCKLAEKRKIPIVVSMGGLAASGGYYVSMAVGHTPDTIFAEPSTWTGSIGVIIPHYDLSGLLKSWNIKEDSIASGPRKQMGSFTKSRTKEEWEEERKLLKGLVDDSFARFKKIVRDGRQEFQDKPALLDELATGQVYSAEQAVDNGLVDKIGYIEEAIERAIELAKLDKKDVKVVEYKRSPNLADVLLGSQARSRPPDLAGLLEMTAPRAYYLCTWLPPLAGTQRP